MARAYYHAKTDSLVTDTAIIDSRAVLVDEAYAKPGLIRSKSVTPPPMADGRIRVVEIVGLDRQVCGGTHLGSTGCPRTFRILKIDNKGRRNRRLRLALEGACS
jgi:misacylated tRNA(Ala) deacylase